MTADVLSPNRWTSCVQTRSAPRLRLFCLPFAGGGASSYRSWSAALPDHIEVLPVQLPGRESRLREPPLTNITVLVDGVIDALGSVMDEMPFALFGHSFGALICFEIARRRAGEGKVPPEHLLVSGRRSPQLPPYREPVHDLPRDQLELWIREMEGTPREVLDDRALMDYALPVLRADLSIEEVFLIEARAVIDCPITAFGGTADEGIGHRELAGWSHFTTGPFDLRMFPGGHFFPFNESQQATLQTVSRVLRVPAAG